MNVYKRITKAFDAAMGRKETCEGNCSCHSMGSDLGDAKAEAGEELGGFVDYDFSGCSDELQEVLDSMLSPSGLAKLQEELDRQNGVVKEGESEISCGDPTRPDKPCIHMEVIFKCHVGDGDSKPANCALSTCPARAQSHLREQVKERENGIMFN